MSAKHLLNVAKTAGKKKQRLPSVFFFSSLSGVQTGIPSGPSGGIPSPLVGSELRLCRPFATLFYLSTLPPASPSLPSAVGRSSVPVGIGNITKAGRRVKKLGPLFPFLFYLFFKFYETSCALFLR